MELQVGVKAFIQNSSGQYLILKRATAYEGETEPRWDIPGGRIIPGETLAQALAREIREETTMTMKGEPKLLHAQDILRVKGRHVVRLTFTVRVSGKIQLEPGAHTDYQWVTLSALKKLHHDLYLAPVVKLLK